MKIVHLASQFNVLVLSYVLVFLYLMTMFNRIRKIWYNAMFALHCVVTCVIMQKNGAGLHTASSCFWNSNTDGN